ncbi:lipid asymmetry ABC transporter MlaABCDEF, periplasmic component MlaD [Campylobacter subantarcticus LMG 24377]|uniref:Lipid asymmetry ABC transporter MlaABCDEF, periplasmic component MlaD n=2 Tax=Campylobacter subantarcticus TaxID=497724 RepID=A0A0A8H7J3_9BACT|nr:MlaD family protein [Campylobacter subantarcticus]EAJ1260785.1 MCE family protein [Campylobacter lari]AJC90031.1 lipid asymmetry ABC transporter MlaABCDEF, periplasmic component MlaD [Campylobacter subantarcticus LMG 24374]AJC91697.1 lipid asymmetry ABC transporter MlaABCDEF, periplasmic component MlaD [Campylobacter subantarcticus LMG 24377]EAL3939019.1 MCE family protein [Campylobacter lari]MPB98856.1 MCE family protein [Campylobacter subantarcticus]
MENKANYILIGVFVSVLFFISLYFIIWYGNLKDEKSFKYYEIYMEESVAGLSVKAPVKFLGVDVGSVENISIDSSSKQLRVKILVKLDSNLVVKTDTYASLQIQGITGFKFIQLAGGSEEASVLKTNGDVYPIIKSKVSFFTNIDKQANNLLELINVSKVKLENLLNDKNLKNIEQILQNSSDLFAYLNANTPIFLENLSKTSSKLGKSSDDFSIFLNNANSQLNELNKSRMLLNENLDILRVLFLDFTQLLKNLKQNPSDVIYKDKAIQYAPGE